MNIDQDVHSTPPGIPPGSTTAPRRKPSLIVLGAAVAAALAIGGGIGFAAGHRPTPTTSGSAIPATTDSAPPPQLSPQAAQAQTCEVLKTGYPQVSRAIDEVGTHNKDSWSDPALLDASNQLVDSMNRLISDLESSLGPATPPELRNAVLEYVAGLRAVSISERSHASNTQLGGTGLFYNEVVDAPLRICGIPG